MLVNYKLLHIIVTKKRVYFVRITQLLFTDLNQYSVFIPILIKCIGKFKYNTHMIFIKN